MIFFQEGAGSKRQVRRWLAKELGSMKNIIELFLSAIKAESDTGVAAALSPFFFRPGSRLDISALRLGLEGPCYNSRDFLQ